MNGRTYACGCKNTFRRIILTGYKTPQNCVFWSQAERQK